MVRTKQPGFKAAKPPKAPKAPKAPVAAGHDTEAPPNIQRQKTMAEPAAQLDGRIAKPAARRLRASRKARSGDIRPELVLPKDRAELLEKVAAALKPFIVFHRGKRMFDEKGAAQEAFDLLISLYANVRPDRAVSEQAVVEACKLLVATGEVSTADMVSDMPQLLPTGEVLTQPGCASKRVFTRYVRVAPSETDLPTTMYATEAAIPTLEDMFPLAEAADEAEAKEDRAALLAACVAPSLLAFKGHVNFFTNPATAEWLLPSINVPFINATLPCKAKIALLDRSMAPAIAINGDDAGASNVARTILRDHDCPVYTVGTSTRDGVPTIQLYEAACPGPARLAGMDRLIIDALQRARATGKITPELTFVEALDVVLTASGLPGTDTILVVKAPVVAVAAPGAKDAEGEEDSDVAAIESAMDEEDEDNKDN
jgi:hypothetical protein